MKAKGLEPCDFVNDGGRHNPRFLASLPLNLYISFADSIRRPRSTQATLRCAPAFLGTGKKAFEREF